MATNKAISVKVKTDKLMTALTEALASRKKELAVSEKAEADHRKAIKDWESKVVEFIKTGKAKVSKVNHTRNWRNETEEAEVTITLTSALAFPKDESNNRSDWQVKAEIEELENAIAILAMSDEEFVSTSTYKGVARLIK